MPEDERRIALRFDPATFKRLNDKRYSEGTSFQSIGAALFLRWLGNEIALAQTGDAAAPNSGEARLTDLSIPAKDPEEALGDIPGDVVSLLQKHWSDPDFRACVGALGAVWNVGDGEIKASLVANCHTFARSSEMVEVLTKGVSTKLSPFDRERIKRLLEHADRIKPQAVRSESVSGSAHGSAAGSAEVGGGPIPPGAGGGRPK